MALVLVFVSGHKNLEISEMSVKVRPMTRTPVEEPGKEREGLSVDQVAASQNRVRPFSLSLQPYD